MSVGYWMEKEEKSRRNGAETHPYLKSAVKAIVNAMSMGWTSQFLDWLMLG